MNVLAFRNSDNEPGIVCEACGEKLTSKTKSVLQVFGNKFMGGCIIRRRVCTCGERIKTVEIPYKRQEEILRQLESLKRQQYQYHEDIRALRSIFADAEKKAEEMFGRSR